jgi:hypothetical protein
MFDIEVHEYIFITPLKNNWLLYAQSAITLYISAFFANRLYLCVCRAGFSVLGGPLSVEKNLGYDNFF